MPYHTPHRSKIKKFGFEFSLASVQLAFIISAAFLIGSLILHKQQQNRSGWQVTQGHVSSVRRETDARGQTMYRKVITYSANGGDYTIDDTATTSWPPRVGGVKAVSYNPSNPSDAAVKMTRIWQFIFTTLFPLLGALLLLYAIFGLVIVLTS